MDKFVIRGGNPLVGTVRVSGAKNAALPAMAAALLTEEPVILEGIPDVRDIQTERKLLESMGAEVEEFDDGLRVAGPTSLRGARIDPRGDHRIAMAFAVGALLAEGETEITDSGCVAISFPEFFELLESVAER